MFEDRSIATEPGPRPSLTEEAYRRLKEEILENRMPPGFLAVEQDLAKILEMSRTPVREALIRLRQEGLVQLIPRRGMRVLPLSPDDMREIYQVLICVESEAAALLANRHPDRETLTPLEGAVDDMETALENDDLETWAAADDRFHRQLVGLCGNRRLATIASTYRNQVHRARMLTLRLRDKPVRSTADHREQIDAIRAGDANSANLKYRRHREQAADELLDILRIFKLNNL
jgi:DNA-binding GntR family transcriptional regulator